MFREFNRAADRRSRTLMLSALELLIHPVPLPSQPGPILCVRDQHRPAAASRAPCIPRVSSAGRRTHAIRSSPEPVDLSALFPSGLAATSWTVRRITPNSVPLGTSLNRVWIRAIRVIKRPGIAGVAERLPPAPRQLELRYAATSPSSREPYHTSRALRMRGRPL